MAYISKINVEDTEYDLKDTQARNRIAELNELIDELNAIDIDLYSYGVEWDTEVNSPVCTRIGNPLLHKSLPILSAYKGCIAQENNLIYYLDPNDWHYKQGDSGTNITGVSVSTNNDNTATITIPSDAPTIDQGVYVRFNNNSAQANSVQANSEAGVPAGTDGVSPISPIWGLVIEKTDSTIKVRFEEILDSSQKETINSNTSITTGANLSGYDGTVRVHTPKFYGKSGSNGTKRWVRISTVKIDDTWMEIPEMFIDAYRCTVLNTVPVNMGYLSTLPANSTVSVVNTSTYCRGGNSSSYDSYLTTDLNRTNLGKPKTSIERKAIRPYATNAGSELLCYEFYKWIFCWNYVIEYANFNCQLAFNPVLIDGYHLGGLGNGITNISLWSEYNGYNPLTPCGWGNKFGNFTEIEDLEIPKFKYTKYSSYLKDYSANTDIVTASNLSNDKKITAVKNIDNYAFKIGQTNVWGTITYTVTGLSEGLTPIFKEGADYPTATVITPTISNGSYKVSWSGYNLGGSKYIGFSTVENTCNIVISSNRNTTELESSIQTLKMPRWRGFDNPFGDIWTNLDGIVLKRGSQNSASTIYTTTDASKFDDTDTLMSPKGETEIAVDGYIKEFDLGMHGEIIPSLVGGSTTTYKCDYHYCNPTSTSLRTLLVGSYALDGGWAGFFYFCSYHGVGGVYSTVGFRTLTRK